MLSIDLIVCLVSGLILLGNYEASLRIDGIQTWRPTQFLSALVQKSSIYCYKIGFLTACVAKKCLKFKVIRASKRILKFFFTYKDLKGILFLLLKLIYGPFVAFYDGYTDKYSKQKTKDAEYTELRGRAGRVLQRKRRQLANADLL